ncbi:MAG: hypothetical protein ABJA57_05670 [Ginsengibacter sp.]
MQQLSVNWMDTYIRNDINYLENILSDEFRLLATVNEKPLIVSRTEWLNMMPVYIDQTVHYQDSDPGT